MKFEYTNKTTVDDIIEHILMRLSTDFAGGCLQVPDFCPTSEYDYDTRMELKIRSKMYKHGVAERCNGTGQPDTAIALRAKGVDVYESGGWKQYLIGFEIEEQTRRERENQPPIQVSGNAVIGNNDSGVVQGRDFLNNSSPMINTAPQQAQPKQKAETATHTIWDKAKYISGIIAGLGGMAAAVVAVGRLLHWW